MRVLQPFFQLLASALYWQSYIFGCIILRMPGVVPVVCAMFCFYLFLCLWELHMWYFYIEEIQCLLSFGLIQFIAHVARFKSFVALFAATSLWPEKFFVLVGGSYRMADVICDIPAFNFVWSQVGKWFADVRFFLSNFYVLLKLISIVWSNQNELNFFLWIFPISKSGMGRK